MEVLAMSSTNFRSKRFRTQSLLPPPLPLINLPEESRLACTGVLERPTHLPVRRHIPNRVAIAALKSRTDGGPKCPQDFDNLQTPKPEPILRESRTLLDSEAEEYQELPELARLHVYEYNQPEMCRNSSTPDDTLHFDSLFEGGNLQRAQRIFRSLTKPQQEYELLIHPDTKNGAYRQWFYFEVRNGKPGINYRFSLVNLAKSGALFGQGLQPVVYSEQDAAMKGVGWRHRGTSVWYSAATSPLAPPGANALTFQYQFEHENDCVYFACIQPYTYTDLMDYLELLERDPQRSVTCRRTELCQSLAGNACDLLTITSPGKDGLVQNERRIIVLSARVHPGEPNSSWMMQGMLDYLTGPSTGAVILRRNFIFKVVPMLNPDGVINGNTRVSLAGWDLNRKWSNPIEQLFPTVYHLKQQLAHFQAHGRVAIYCDLHGHSINRNIFTYGCYTSKKKTDTSNPTVKTDPRVFPMIVARHAPCFSFSSCDFSVHKSKLTTARVVVNQELGVTNSYTLEASFCGPDFGVHKDTQFSTWDLEEMGRSWCQSLLVYYGLTRQVKALEAERETLSTQSISVELRPTESQVEAEDEASGLLLDCEAAISALFTHSAMDTKDDAIDSDLSGAEEEPIPPSPEEISPDSHNEWKKQGDEGGGDGEGYSSAPDTAPTCSNHTSKVKKKTGRRKRGSVVSKPKSSFPSTSRKTDSKPKKKKHKGKAELRPTSSTKRVPTSSLGSKPEDTSVTTALEPAGFIIVQPPKDNSESVPRTTPKEKRAATARRSKSISSRPKLSRDIPRSITSAILQATMNADTCRLRSMTEYQRTPSATLLVLPSVLGGSFRGTNAVPRILKTAPAYNDQENSAREDKSRFNLSRMRSELPVLVHSSRDEEQQRLSRRPSRGQENDDVRSDASSDERSEPEAYGSSF